MTQNILTAGNATSAFSQAAGDDGTFKIVVGPNGSQVDGITVDATGQLTFKKPPKSTDAASMVRLHTANGYGSTNTMIRRFTNVVVNQGSDITYADSATAGASFTINTNGVYAISYYESFTPANGVGGISLNSTQLTTSVLTMNVANRLAMFVQASSNIGATVSWTGYLVAGDVIRPHNDGSAVGASTSSFTITRVA